MAETTAKSPQLVSPTYDEYPPLLPEELISEILIRVPVRSLLQFRCVCKAWKTLISNPQFAKDHLRASIADPTMANQRLVSTLIGRSKITSCSVQSLLENPSALIEPLSFAMNRDYRILGSCNGILCLSDVHLSYVRLWNPSIRFISEKVSIKKFIPLASDNTNSIAHHGFGYDHVNDKYKLLIIGRDSGKARANILTFGGAKYWNTIPNLPYCLTTLKGKFVSGTLNWVAKPNRGESDDKEVILSFDLGTLKCSEVLLPAGNIRSMWKPTIDVVRGCVCVLYFDSEKNNWALWLMKEYGIRDSWTKLMTIPGFVVEVEKGLVMLYTEWCNTCGDGWFPSFDPFCVSENGIALLISFTELFLYDSNDGRPISVRFKGCDMQSYHESLVLPP